MNLLIDVNKSFVVLVKEKLNIAYVEVTSSSEMDENMRNQLSDKLSDITSKKIDINFSTNKDLIGGLKIKIDDMLFDSSLKTKLENAKSTVGKSRPAVSNSLRLLNLPLEIQDSILKNEINAGQARAILQKKTTQGMILLWRRLLKEKMSVRKVEAAASNNTKWDQQIKQIETNISRIIGTKVSISNNKKTKKGFVKIHFDSKTWDRVISKLKSVKSDFE